MTSALRPVSDLFQAGASHYKKKLGHYQKPINPAYGGIGAPWFAQGGRYQPRKGIFRSLLM